MRFYSFLFFLLFLFLFFYFGRHIGLPCMGVNNLFKGVNDTRKGVCIVRGGFVLFLNLSLRPNVLGVWIAKGGIYRLNTTRS